ncbi:MAG TPA: hypothetical protein VFB43_20170 [Terracidiphilus sp.]|nr:hypothetical protein [Terracidiphilus sp.]
MSPINSATIAGLFSISGLLPFVAAARWMVWATYVLDCSFFIGLTGCALVVIISWISIFKEGFSDDD